MSLSVSLQPLLVRISITATTVRQHQFRCWHFPSIKPCPYDNFNHQQFAMSSQYITFFQSMTVSLQSVLVTINIDVATFNISLTAHIFSHLKFHNDHNEQILVYLQSHSVSNGSASPHSVIFSIVIFSMVTFSHQQFFYCGHFQSVTSELAVVREELLSVRQEKSSLHAKLTELRSALKTSVQQNKVQWWIQLLLNILVLIIIIR